MKQEKNGYIIPPIIIKLKLINHTILDFIKDVKIQVVSILIKKELKLVATNTKMYFSALQCLYLCYDLKYVYLKHHPFM